MDPVRGLIHLGLKVTETTLDRALDVVRLADTLLVSTAVPPVRDRDTGPTAWPEEEQADLDALSATLRARATPAEEPSVVSTSPARRTPPRKAPATRATPKGAGSAQAKARPAKKAAVTKAAAKKASGSTKASAKKASATKAPAKKASATRAAPKKAPAKKSTAKKAAHPQRSTEAPTLTVLPDA